MVRDTGLCLIVRYYFIHIRFIWRCCNSTEKEEWRSGYMKEMAVIMDAKEEGAAEERKNTEAERKRADGEKKRADAAEAELARYKAAFGELT